MKDQCWECVNYDEENERKDEDGILISDCFFVKATNRWINPTVEHYSVACDEFVRGVPKSLTDRPGGWPTGMCRVDAVAIKTVIVTSGLSTYSLSKRFNMSHSTICAIRNGQSWYNVPVKEGLCLV